MSDQDTPGTDWQAKHEAAGSQAGQPQHPSYTTADGPVNTRPDVTDTPAFLDMINGEQR